MTAILVAPDESFRQHLYERLVQADCEEVRVAEPVSELANLLLGCDAAVAVLGGGWPEVRPFVPVAMSAQALAVLVVQPQGALHGESHHRVHSALGDTHRPRVALRLGAGAVLDESAREALEMGARAVLCADISDSALKAALAASRAGLIVIDGCLEAPPESLHTDPTSQAASRRTGRQPRQLTMRERKILSLIASGTSNKGVARSLGVSVNTVKFHLTAAFEKLNAATRAEAVTEAIRRGELSL